MEKIFDLVERLFDLSTSQQLFVLAVMAMLVVGFSLFVVLAALKKTTESGDRK
jgi:hypothetical protein